MFCWGIKTPFVHHLTPDPSSLMSIFMNEVPQKQADCADLQADLNSDTPHKRFTPTILMQIHLRSPGMSWRRCYAAPRLRAHCSRIEFTEQRAGVLLLRGAIQCSRHHTAKPAQTYRRPDRTACRDNFIFLIPSWKLAFPMSTEK